MSGRHARSSRAPVLAIVGALALVAAGAVGFALRDDDPGRSAGGRPSAAASPGSCPDGAEPLSVVVAPELREITQAAARRAGAADPCHRYSVTAPDGNAAITTAMAQEPPAVWVPDSSTWLDALPADLAGRWSAGSPVATSPVGLVVPSGQAEAPAPDSWASVVRGTQPLQLADPDRDAASRLAFYTSMVEQAGPLDRATGARLIVMSRFTKPSNTALLDGYAADPAAAPAFPSSERAAFAYAAQHPKTPLAITFPKAGTTNLDYPWLRRADLDADAAASAEALRTELASAASRAALTSAGFRAADGSGPGPEIDDRPGPTLTTLPVPTPAQRDQAAAQWHVLRTDMRMLAVLDVSGSMAWDSGTAGLTRMDVLLGSASRALQNLAPGSKIGAWVFSTAQTGSRQDWRELAPLRRLDAKVGARTRREELVRLLGTVRGRVRGDTGLYDTTLAAVDHMLATYEPDYVNSVVLMTDGVNDDTTGGISLSTLLARLRDRFDPDRPIRIVTIGMGEADARALKRISAATGGTSYIANTPADIDRVLVQALLARPLPVTK
ncbi:MAG: substrate-binding domain-containing protein [Tetrasphaera sp.]